MRAEGRRSEREGAPPPPLLDVGPRPFGARVSEARGGGGATPSADDSVGASLRAGPAGAEGRGVGGACRRAGATDPGGPRPAAEEGARAGLPRAFPEAATPWRAAVGPLVAPAPEARPTTHDPRAGRSRRCPASAPITLPRSSNGTSSSPVTPPPPILPSPYSCHCGSMFKMSRRWKGQKEHGFCGVVFFLFKF